ncbi:esterase-like activity of phytase family protein [Sinosporangium siamense]|uniref:3-phytase n=1 Tax=Sinosporangium siamense TaxID=1367973 RepID=A0A919RDD1_9ACTN|nr:esterase-like activity of phytase family protein [Sinosporangium siamense]GII91627.1 3-phytase [Sinosporangium siamense]
MTRWRSVTRVALALATIAGITGAGTHPAGAAAPREVQITRFLGEQRVEHKLQYAGTTVGGFSGIDRDPLTNTWYFLSDDRARYNPARFYTGKLDFNRVTGAFTGVRLTGVKTLLRADGTPYPGFGLPETVDPETIRFDRWTRRLLWGDEGDRPDASRPTLPISDPRIRWTGRDGKHVSELQSPDNLKYTDTDRGPRRNFAFEGLTFTPTGIAAVVEGPRFEDGPIPSVERGAPARITVWHRDGRVRAQHAYPIDPLPAAPIPPTGVTDSGVSEILALDDHRYLALERSWIEGVNYKAKLYEIDLRGATNILTRDSLTDGTPYRPVTKRLVYDFSALPFPTQNLESLAFGPRLLTGECTLVIGSDDNFDPRETTHFLAFAAHGC